MNIRVATDTAEVRACTPDDMPAVAGLFQRSFRHARRAAPERLSCSSQPTSPRYWRYPTASR